MLLPGREAFGRNPFRREGGTEVSKAPIPIPEVDVSAEARQSVFPRTRPAGAILGTLVRYFILLLMAFLFVFPFYFVFVVATHPIPFANPPHIWFGTAIADNVDALFGQIPFVRSFLNSLGIATLATVTVISWSIMKSR